VSQFLEGGEPFFFPGGETGCLLIHGFTGAPKEMLGLGEHLAAQGYTVLGPRLFGHSTVLKDMVRARWIDWVASTLDGYYLIRGACTKVVLMGLSVGGALALYLGAHYPVDGLVAMSTPYLVPHPLVKLLRPFLPLLSLIWRFKAKGPSDWRDSEAAKDHVDYEGYPIRGAVEVDNLLAKMRLGLPQITAPVLLMYSRGDATVTAEHAQAIHDDLRSSEVKIMWFENSGHVITRDAEREAVFAAATEFVRQVTG
jgi:carboxylesterase